MKTLTKGLQFTINTLIQRDEVEKGKSQFCSIGYPFLNVYLKIDTWVIIFKGAIKN